MRHTSVSSTSGSGGGSVSAETLRSLSSSVPDPSPSSGSASGGGSSSPTHVVPSWSTTSTRAPVSTSSSPLRYRSSQAKVRSATLDSSPPSVRHVPCPPQIHSVATGTSL